MFFRRQPCGRVPERENEENDTNVEGNPNAQMTKERLSG